MNKLTDESPIWFGVHKGKKLANVPGSWLLWYYKTAYNNMLHENNPLSVYIHENLEILKKERDESDKTSRNTSEHSKGYN